MLVVRFRVLAIHLGGPERVIRRRGIHTLDVDVAANSLTLIPQGEPFEWETFRRIDFAHFVARNEDVKVALVEEYDREPETLGLAPLVGVENRTVAHLLNTLLADAPNISGGRLYRDTLSLLLSLNIVQLFGREAVRGVSRRRAGTLATWQLRRVTEHMREHLGEDIDLATLVALTGLGRAQFFRSFKRSRGRTPLAHLRHLRLLQARRLLVDTNASITGIACCVGYEPTRLSAAFKAEHDMTPSMFRASAKA